jgi:hypothetical protein
VIQSFLESLASAEVRGRLARFVLVALLNNILLLGLFAGLRALSAPTALSLGVVYLVAICIGFVGNSKFAFRAGRSDWALIGRYILVNAVTFLINLWLLDFLPALLGTPIEAVQFVLIFALGGLTFVALNWFVFPRQESDLR